MRGPATHVADQRTIEAAIAGRQRGRNDVVDVGEVTRLRAVAVDHEGHAVERLREESRDHAAVLGARACLGPKTLK